MNPAARYCPVRYFIVAVALIACGCTRSSESPPAPVGGSTTNSVTVPAAAISPEQLESESGLAIKRGIVTVTDTHSYRACGANVDSTLLDQTDGLLTRVYMELGGKALYVEAYGERAPTTFTLEELLYASSRDPVASCGAAPTRYELLALGSEPAWSVEITQDSMILKQSGAPEIAFTAVETSDTEGTVTYRGGVDKHVLELTVTQHACQDGGAFYGYNAVAKFDKLVLNGCARVGE